MTMTKSTLTTKYRTTVPKEVRERLGINPQDVLQWEVADGYAQVSLAGRAFLRRRGTIHTGPGSVSGDVRRGRALRGREVE
jgi:bifunctional DNA-binding transcriptional regulator/antitoxin component of YhaV-PrlF toxin-antitoxin module